MITFMTFSFSVYDFIVFQGLRFIKYINQALLQKKNEHSLERHWMVHVKMTHVSMADTLLFHRNVTFRVAQP